VVRIKRTIEEELICEPCTEEEAEKEPLKFAVDRRELETTDFSVLKVEPND
jgi:hypothetical protein